MTLLQRIEDLVTGSSLNPRFQKLRYIITGLITLAIGSILIFNGLILANNLNNSNIVIRRKNQLRILRSPEELNLQNYERQNQNDLKQKIDQEFLQASLIILIVIVLLSYFSLYYMLKPLSDNISHRESFIARASHELRTPLAILYSELSLGASLDQIEPIQQILLESKDEIKRLQTLADNLLSQNSEQNISLSYETSHETSYKSNSDLINSIWTRLSKSSPKLTDLEFNKDEINEQNWDTSKSNRYILIQELFWNILDNTFKHGNIDKAVVINARKNTLVISNEIQSHRAANPKKIQGLIICQDICRELGWKFSTKVQNDLFLVEIKVMSSTR